MHTHTHTHTRTHTFVKFPPDAAGLAFFEEVVPAFHSIVEFLDIVAVRVGRIMVIGLFGFDTLQEGGVVAALRRTGTSRGSIPAFPMNECLNLRPLPRRLRPKRRLKRLRLQQLHPPDLLTIHQQPHRNLLPSQHHRKRVRRPRRHLLPKPI